MLFDSIQLIEGSALQNATIASGDTFPTEPTPGELFYRTDIGNLGLYVYDGTAWQISGPTTGPTGPAGVDGITGPTGPTGPAGADGTFTGGTVSNATIFSSDVTFGTNYKETRVAITSASSTSIDCSLGNVFNVSMAASITSLSFSNVPASGTVYSATLFLNQDATGSRTVAWPASVKWAGATTPTLTTTASKTDIITLVTHDGGTSWYAFVAGLNF